MLEEYLDGPEVDVDLVFSEGQAVYGAITDNWPTVEPYFNETGSNCPSILPTKQQQELMELAVQATQCLGFKLVRLPCCCVLLPLQGALCHLCRPVLAYKVCVVIHTSFVLCG